MEKARQFPYAIPKKVGVLEIPANWHNWAVRETVQTPWKHFYLRTAHQVLELLTQQRFISAPTSLSGVLVLDVGCTPSVSVLLACLGAKVVLVDINPDELRKGLRYARLLSVENDVDVIQADAFNLPFTDGTFAIVWNSGFIEHFDCPVHIIRNMARMARLGGSVVVLVPSPWTPHSLWIRERLRRRRDGYCWDRMGPELSYSEKDLIRLFRDAGLQVVTSCTMNLRRSFLDDNLLMSRICRPMTNTLLLLMNLSDWIERLVPPIRQLGFMAGVAATVGGS